MLLAAVEQTTTTASLAYRLDGVEVSRWECNGSTVILTPIVAMTITIESYRDGVRDVAVFLRAIEHRWPINLPPPPMWHRDIRKNGNEVTARFGIDPPGNQGQGGGGGQEDYITEHNFNLATGVVVVQPRKPWVLTMEQFVAFVRFHEEVKRIVIDGVLS